MNKFHKTNYLINGYFKTCNNDIYSIIIGYLEIKPLKFINELKGIARPWIVYYHSIREGADYENYFEFHMYYRLFTSKNIYGCDPLEDAKGFINYLVNVKLMVHRYCDCKKCSMIEFFDLDDIVFTSDSDNSDYH